MSNDESYKLQIPQHNWSPSAEKLVRQWKEKAQGNAWMHFQSARYFDTWHIRFGSFACIVITVAGSTLLATEKWSNTAVTLVIGFISIIAGIVSGLQTFLELKSKSNQHRRVANGFSKIIRVIEGELILEPHERVDSKDFIEYIGEDYEKWLTESIEIPRHITEIYYKNINANVVALPEVFVNQELRRTDSELEDAFVNAFKRNSTAPSQDKNDDEHHVIEINAPPSSDRSRGRRRENNTTNSDQSVTSSARARTVPSPPSAPRSRGFQGWKLLKDRILGLPEIDEGDHTLHAQCLNPSSPRFPVYKPPDVQN